MKSYKTQRACDISISRWEPGNYREEGFIIPEDHIGVGFDSGHVATVLIGKPDQLDIILRYALDALPEVM